MQRTATVSGGPVPTAGAVVRAFAVGIVVMLIGCASTPQVPPVPADFDPGNVTVAPAPRPVDPVRNETGGKGDAAVQGAVVGAGVGFAYGGLACMAAGPLAPLCLAVIVPASTLATALGTGAAMAVVADGAELVLAKQGLLRTAVRDMDTGRRLADGVAERLRSRQGVAASQAGPTWVLQVALTRLETIGRGDADPLPLAAEGQAQLLHPDSGETIWTRRFVVRSRDAHPLAGWQADDAAAARRAVDAMLQDLAREIASVLAQ